MLSLVISTIVLPLFEGGTLQARQQSFLWKVITLIPRACFEMLAEPHLNLHKPSVEHLAIDIYIPSGARQEDSREYPTRIKQQTDEKTMKR